MSIIFQVKRGTKVHMPVLASGEFYLATDVKELYVGTPVGNMLVAKLK